MEPETMFYSLVAAGIAIVLVAAVFFILMKWADAREYKEAEAGPQYKITTDVRGYGLWQLRDGASPAPEFAGRPYKIWYPLASFSTYEEAEGAAKRMKNSEPVYI